MIVKFKIMSSCITVSILLTFKHQTFAELLKGVMLFLVCKLYSLVVVSFYDSSVLVYGVCTELQAVVAICSVHAACK